MNENDLKVEYYKGQGPGGQHKNKTANACRVTHIPTGIITTADCRKRPQSKKRAMKAMQERLVERAESERKAKSKARRDEAIKPSRAIRTYDYSRGVVTDHRTKKTASIKDILVKGRIEKLQ